MRLGRISLGRVRLRHIALRNVSVWSRFAAAGLLAALLAAPLTADPAQARPAKKNGNGEAAAQVSANGKKQRSARVGKTRSRAGGWNHANYAAIVIDDKTGQVLHEANADAPRSKHRPPAVRLERYLLDRYCVNNREYRAFVKAGGYEQMSIWEPDIWPGILDFVDTTGHPGPRYWAAGDYPEGQGDLPVVGISWYEAAAYARWVGKRLPTDPEWEKAGSWPMHLAASGRPQRRFPWGDALDEQCANLWGSRVGEIVPVDAYPEGASIGGIHQLIGNVWEWTSGNFGAWSRPGNDLVLLSPVKSLRGGAYDTYFENQATCQFQSGDSPTSRKHNIGFRCALSVCDLVSLDVEEEEAEPNSSAGTDAEETT